MTTSAKIQWPTMLIARHARMTIKTNFFMETGASVFLIFIAFYRHGGRILRDEMPLRHYDLTSRRASIAASTNA